MKQYKSKGLKRRRVLVATGRMSNGTFDNTVAVLTRDGRRMTVAEIKPLVPIDRDQNLIIEWYE